MNGDPAHQTAVLSRMSEYMPGPVIYTGTPSGVGAVVEGDRLDARVEGLPPLSIRIGAQP
jgi:fumarylpyruvate hydrolase